ncbi:hypothetical protein P691DRAFT_133086 [Macrolepiota fuliginosa MF-IS2]|uniref:Uncharacterized protein n=1 Tax=Macrolepiota fuliginosa MF-IS2 TaxID=1400762 RepID=A0A9P5XLA1_9AGAR|nr:hypothetical protein P691DRAFT_133086 [Macrolepiota fuliginosa MF-IS2]
MHFIPHQHTTTPASALFLSLLECIGTQRTSVHAPLCSVPESARRWYTTLQQGYADIQNDRMLSLFLEKTRYHSYFIETLPFAPGSN